MKVKMAWVDKEIRQIVDFINDSKHFKTVASCSGHGTYHPTIFIEDLRTKCYFEFLTCLEIKPIKRRYHCFYVFDKRMKLFYNPWVELFYKITTAFPQRLDYEEVPELKPILREILKHTIYYRGELYFNYDSVNDKYNGEFVKTVIDDIVQMT
jgi:hypothetical protein